MNIIETIKIENESNIIYAKRTLQNILKRINHERSSFLIFSLMELATNLLKHAHGGELWILEDKSNQICIAALDFADGIEDTAWAMQYGTSRMGNSLGIGLFQINRDDFYYASITSFTKSNLHGTVILVQPRNYNPQICSLQKPYITETINGDLFVKKGRFLLLADGSGHGKKAYATSQYIKSQFYEHPFSCILVDDFLNDIHKELRLKNLRGAVLSILEISSQSIQSCGVGNISFWMQKGNEYEYTSQKDGTLGEIFSSSEKKYFTLAKDEKLIAATDGIDVGKMDKILQLLPKGSSSLMIALCAIHFASVTYDDKTILIITQ